MTESGFERGTSRGERGLTIAELLVALVIMAVVISQLMGILLVQNVSYASQERKLDAQASARLVTEMILGDLRMAGFLVPRIVGVSSLDGGANGADTLCTSDWSVMGETEVNGALDVFPRAVLTGNVGAGTHTVSLNGASMDIDGDGDRDFSVGSGIIISDGTGSHCARIETIAGGTMKFIPATIGGFSAAAVAGRAVPAIIYEVTGAGLLRNNVLLSPLVENLQVEFGVDANDDGELTGGEFPVNSLAASNPSQVALVRLSVITKTLIEERDVLGMGMPAAANHVGSPPDGFMRRKVTATIVPRNLP